MIVGEQSTYPASLAGKAEHSATAPGRYPGAVPRHTPT